MSELKQPLNRKRQRKVVKQKDKSGFKYTGVSTELDELSKQDCIYLITIVAKTQMAKDLNVKALGH